MSKQCDFFPISRVTLSSLLLLILLSSCSSFLEEYSKDERIPKTVKDFSEILYGESYLKDYVPHDYLELLTDDVQITVNNKSRVGEDQRNSAFGYFTWQSEPELTENKKMNTDNSWALYYKHILYANIVLSKIDEAVGTPAEKSKLEAECHAVRLFSYLQLANLYASPYDPATASKTPGVPINSLAHAEDTQFPRALLSENYALMIDELKKAEEAFERADGDLSIYRWNKAAVAILGSRLYLYMRDYANAIKYATKALTYKPALHTLSDLNLESDIFLTSQNPEIAYTYGPYKISYHSPAHLSYFSVSDELLKLYESSDLRYQPTNTGGFFIKQKRVRVGGSIFRPIYLNLTNVEKNGESSKTFAYGFAIRSAEALLNRAEAYAETGMLQLALDDLNKLRAARHAKGTFKLTLPATQKEMIQLVRDEKRREFVFEQLRWFDLRRWDRPQIEHFYVTNIEQPEEGTLFTLTQNDPRYTLPIPLDARSSDPALAGE